MIIVSPREQGDMNYIYIMEKKEYLSPEMKEVEIRIETNILAGSGCTGGGDGSGSQTADTEDSECQTDNPADTDGWGAC